MACLDDLGDEDDDDDEDDALASNARADERVLATKRKRASKGAASASTSDAHGILGW